MILAGGSGNRLWPLSRKALPKQFLNLWKDNSLLEQTLVRLHNSRTMNNPIIVCNKDHRSVLDHQLSTTTTHPLRVILEGVGKNTGPAVTMAALSICGNSFEKAQTLETERDSVMVVMPADHMIENQEAFNKAVEVAIDLAKEEKIAILGAPIEFAYDGYGYIEKGDSWPLTESSASRSDLDTKLYEVRRFIEKPTVDIAESFKNSNDYFWNTGILVIKATVWLNLLKSAHPDILEICQNAYAKGTAEGNYFQPHKGIFERCPDNFIAYDLISESSKTRYKPIVIHLESEWHDAGSWASLMMKFQAEEITDTNKNFTAGDIKAVSTHNSLIYSETRFVATIGLENMIVVDSNDALLVAHKDHITDLNRIVSELVHEGRKEYVNHPQTYETWGMRRRLSQGVNFEVNYLTIKPGAKIDLIVRPGHNVTWTIVKGTAFLDCANDSRSPMSVGNTLVSAPSLEQKALRNSKQHSLEIIEIKTIDD